MVLVDGITFLKPTQYIEGYKCLTADESTVTAYSHSNIYPNTYILEGMAQIAGILITNSFGTPNSPSYLVGIDKARFRRCVGIGDRLLYTAQLIRYRTTLSITQTKAFIKADNKTYLVAKAIIKMSI